MDNTSSNKNVATIIAEHLAATGLKRVYGLPGGEMLDLLEALRSAGVEFVLTHHESAAAFMAAAEGQFSRKVSACIATLGPGATNLVTGVAHAYLDRSPVIVLTADTSTNVHKDHSHQRLDLASMFAPITKRSYVVDAGNVEAVITEAIAIASQEPFGPVSLHVPRDVATQEFQRWRESPIFIKSREANGNLSIEELATKLVKATSPLVVVGLATPPGAAVQVRDFIDAYGAPVGVTPKVKGIVDEAHPLFTATYGGMMAESVVGEFMTSRDLVLCIGLDPTEVDVDWPDPERFVWMLPSVNVDQKELPLNTWKGDIADGLTRLIPLLSQHQMNFELEAASVREKMKARLEESIPTELEGMSPLRVLQWLARNWLAINPVCCDVGSHKLLVGQYWPSSYPNRFFMSNGLSSMGFGMAAPVALSLANDLAPVLSIIGDGGLLMFMGELGTAKRMGARVLYVVFQDNALSLIENSQRRRNYLQYGVRFTTLDFTQVASAFEIPVWRVTSEAGLSAALSSFKKSHGPALIVVPIDAREYSKQIG